MKADESFEIQTYHKVDLRLIPFLFLCYILAYLDRVNVGFAKLQMLKDLSLSDAAFASGAGIFFIGYFFFEVPSNVLLKKFGARMWIARIMITWGIVSSCMIFVKGEWSFYAMRFLLGIAEAGFFPGDFLMLPRCRLLAWENMDLKLRLVNRRDGARCLAREYRDTCRARAVSGCNSVRSNGFANTPGPSLPRGRALIHSMRGCPALHIFCRISSGAGWPGRGPIPVPCNSYSAAGPKTLSGPSGIRARFLDLIPSSLRGRPLYGSPAL